MYECMHILNISYVVYRYIAYYFSFKCYWPNLCECMVLQFVFFYVTQANAPEIRPFDDAIVMLRSTNQSENTTVSIAKIHLVVVVAASIVECVCLCVCVCVT